MLAASAWAVAAHAESAFLLSYPSRTGSVPAVAYRDDGTPFGRAELSMEMREDGRVRVAFEAGQPEGARLRASALLEPAEADETLRLHRQRSESFDEQGRSLGLLEVDHAAERARCWSSDGELVERLALPPRDRIVNVPMNLFFLPLVRGDREKLEFQVFICREGARLVDFEAWIEDADSGSRRVEVRYGPDLGPIVSAIARRFAPRLAFWFEQSSPHAWQAHRLPLYTGGPEITVVREGLGVDALE